MLSDREKVVAEVWARSMHPDLYADVPASEAAQELQKRYNYCDQLDDLARIYTHPDIDLPYSVGNCSVSVTQYDFGQKNGGTEQNGYIDEETTKRKMAAAMRALKSLGASIEKHYSDSSFSISATFESGLVFRVNTNRAVLCEKKVIDRIWVEPSQGYYKEVVEWDCNPVSLMDVE
jgi:hypothetical protein